MDAAEPIRVEVAAPIECGTADTFFARIRARTPRVRAARDGEDATTYRVTVTLSEGHASGTVFTDGGELRAFGGASCAEVFEGLALTVALSIDSIDRPAPPETHELPAPAAVAPVVVPVSIPVASAIPVTGAPRNEDRPTPVARHWRAGLGVETSVVAMGALPAMPSPGIFAEAGPDTKGLFALHARASVATMAGDLDTRASFRWWLGRIDACPLQIGFGDTLIARACAGGELGALSSEGLAISKPSSSSTPWFAARGLGTLTWAPSRALFFQATAGIAVPITRHRFLFAPSDVVYTLPSVAPFAGIGAGLSFL